MARTVEVACARCGHQQRVVVETTENDKTAADEASAIEATRLERLKSLPTSLPVGGIITPV